MILPSGDYSGAVPDGAGVVPAEPAAAQGVLAPPHPPGLPPGHVPAPPSGPGVAPPFAAPPTDRDNKSLWLGLGVGGLVLLLCCIGGIVGIGVLAAGGGNRIVESEARAVVSQFLSSIVREDYVKAYALVCSDYTDGNSVEAFERQVSEPAIERFTVNTVTITNDKIIADASLFFAGGAGQARSYPLAQEMDGLKVCGGF